MFPLPLIRLAEEVLAQYHTYGWKIITAESCTGGLISSLLTEISGASNVMYGGYITYDNAAKMRMTGIQETILAAHGAVSKETACAMAEGAIASFAESESLISIAATGVAGPGGGTVHKPVGTVHIASAKHGTLTLHRLLSLKGTREEIRLATVHEALRMLHERCGI